MYMELKQSVDHQTLAANADELAHLKEKYATLPESCSTCKVCISTKFALRP